MKQTGDVRQTGDMRQTGDVITGDSDRRRDTERRQIVAVLQTPPFFDWLRLQLLYKIGFQPLTFLTSSLPPSSVLYKVEPDLHTSSGQNVPSPIGSGFATLDWRQTGGVRQTGDVR